MVLLYSYLCIILPNKNIMFLSYYGYKNILFTPVFMYDRFQLYLIPQWLFISYWWSPPHPMAAKRNRRITTLCNTNNVQLTYTHILALKQKHCIPLPYFAICLVKTSKINCRSVLFLDLVSTLKKKKFLPR